MTNREKAIQLRKEHPMWTLQEIGDKLHITRERVRQILKSEQLRTSGYFPRVQDRRPQKPLYHFNRYIAAGIRT